MCCVHCLDIICKPYVSRLRKNSFFFFWLKTWWQHPTRRVINALWGSDYFYYDLPIMRVVSRQCARRYISITQRHRLVQGSFHSEIMTTFWLGRTFLCLFMGSRERLKTIASIRRSTHDYVYLYFCQKSVVPITIRCHDVLRA